MSLLAPPSEILDPPLQTTQYTLSKTDYVKISYPEILSLGQCTTYLLEWFVYIKVLYKYIA